MGFRSGMPRAVYGFFLSALASIWRRAMFRTTFIAVTGSLGKTTTTRAIATILSLQFPTNSTQEGKNSRIGLARSVLRTRSRHQFTVLEIGTNRAGALRRAAWQVKPDIVVILCVARCHTDRFPTLEYMAAEKALLLSRLGTGGVAILNGDDPRVLAMISSCRCRVLTFGRSPRFTVWASEISGRWPSRLSFTAHFGERVQRIHTRLVGEHWLTSALASVAAALACGMDLETAAEAIERNEPYLARMQPMPLPSGATMIRDDFIASVDAYRAALHLMTEARARRKLLVISDVEDSGEGMERRLAELGRSAAQAVDFAIFFGEHSEVAATAALAAGLPPGSVRTFPTQKEAGVFLKSELREGDLVLLRDSGRDHVERIYWAQFGSVGCSKLVCSYLHACDVCPQLRPELEGSDELSATMRPVWQPRSRSGP
jgi:UDP-N-acetylmuramoyl-tripeptide--D-alanyl-D-alanine ligase